MAEKLFIDTRIRVGALICFCFLLGSTGWLSWLYRIAELAEPSWVDIYTMVCGYLAQACGLGAFMIVSRNAGFTATRRAVIGSLVAYVVLLEPATTSNGLVATLAFGWAMNIFCGFSQGYYLESIARCVQSNSRGVVYGAGYAVSTAFTWLFSNIGSGALSFGIPCFILCIVLAILSIIAIFWVDGPAQAQQETAAENESHALSQKAASTMQSSGIEDGALEPGGSNGHGRSAGSIIAFAGAVVVLVSLVKNMGFSFPTADLSSVVDLELSRLFYGIGLIAAGIAADRNRRYVLACCAASLAMPFLMLALTGAGASGVILWALGYLLFGFFTVFRITLFADLAAESDRPWLAAAGLLFGRIGDVLGTLLCLALGPLSLVLIICCAVLFAVSMGVLFLLYQRLYVKAAVQSAAQPPERDMFSEFCMRYGLSAREREVLPLLLDGKTNAEIAEKLFVTESTVKYHVRNIRKKTGCKTRLDVADLYANASSR